MSDEWVLVPRVPVNAMIEAAENTVWVGPNTAREAWEAMIAAAPPPPEIEGDLTADNHRLRHHMRRVIAEREIYRAALVDIAYWPDAMGDLWKKRAANAIEQAMQK